MVFNNIVNPCGFDIRFLKTLYYLLRFCALADYFSRTKIIKTRLEGAKGIWPEELPSVLWACRTTARTPIREILFRLAYRNEAIILVEVGLISYRVDNHDEWRNDEAMRLQLDLLDEVRAIAEQRLA